MVGCHVTLRQQRPGAFEAHLCCFQCPGNEFLFAMLLRLVGCNGISIYVKRRLLYCPDVVCIGPIDHRDNAPQPTNVIISKEKKRTIRGVVNSGPWQTIENDPRTYFDRVHENIIGFEPLLKFIHRAQQVPLWVQWVIGIHPSCVVSMDGGPVRTTPTRPLFAFHPQFSFSFFHSVVRLHDVESSFDLYNGKSGNW